MRKRRGACLAAFVLLACGSDDGHDAGTGSDAGSENPPADGRLPGSRGDDARSAVGLWDDEATAVLAPNPLLEQMVTSMTNAIAVVDESVTVGAINAALDAAGVRIVGGIPDATLVVTIAEPSFERLRAAVESLQGSGAFIGVGEDTAVVSAVVPDDRPDMGSFVWTWGNRPSGANWHLEHIRVPAVWSIVQAIELEHCTDPLGVTVGAVDMGWSPHSDLRGARWTANPNVDDEACVAKGNQPGCGPDGREYHALGVAGVMAAGTGLTGPGIQGVNPWADVVGRSLPLGFAVPQDAPAGTEAIVGEARRLMKAVYQLVSQNPANGSAGLRIVNLSLGGVTGNYNPDTRSNPVIDGVIDAQGWAAATQLNDLINIRHHDFAIFLAASNACPDHGMATNLCPRQATYMSAYSTARTLPGSAADLARSRVLVVEATAPPGWRSPDLLPADGAWNGWRVETAHFTARGGDVSAPGAKIGTLTAGSYAYPSGTSESAPIAAGMASLLSMLDLTRPGAESQHLSPTQILDVLRDPNVTIPVGPSNPGAEEVDALNSVLFLDGGFTCGRYRTALLDVDDGTEHGMQLVTYGPYGQRFPYRGDRMPNKVIDMGDFRSFRTAYQHYTTDMNWLSPDHPKLDLNGNDRLRTSDPADREHHARQDFNGDGLLDLTSTRDVLGVNMTDLDMLTEVDAFGQPRCFRDNGELWRVSDLPHLAQSADILFKLHRLLPDAQTHMIRGGQDVEIRSIEILWDLQQGALVGAPGLRRTIRVGDNGQLEKDHVLLTVPLGGQLKIRAFDQDDNAVCTMISGDTFLDPLQPSGQYEQVLQVSCAAGNTCCGDHCADVDTSERDCGRCGRPCDQGFYCIDGDCQEPEVCEDPDGCGEELCCNGNCYNPDDPEVCGGSCETPCLAGEICCGGTCCPETDHCCGDNPSQCCGPHMYMCPDGREHDLFGSDPRHCRGCDTQLDEGTACCRENIWGVTDLSSDWANCGACGHKCSINEECCRGTCVNAMVCDGPCDSGGCGIGECCFGECVDEGECQTWCELGLCEGGVCPNRYCVDLMTNPWNCGGIDVACRIWMDEWCIQGSCVLREDMDDPLNCGDNGLECESGFCCDGECLWDEGYNDEHCGACDSPCAAGQSCCNGTCCASGEECCDGLCVDTRVGDPEHCGGCDAQCAEGQDCCDWGCVDTTSDVNACGACGTVCSGDDLPELAGPDVTPDDPFPYPEPLCCDSSCADGRYDEANCGGCGIACSEGELCCLGSCIDPKTTKRHCGDCHAGCEEDERCCGGECTDVSTDSLHCGSCNAPPCEPPASCVGGSCVCEAE